MSASPLNLCITGIGGYALNHHAVALELEQRGELRLLATCDPRREKLRGAADKFAFSGRGVEALESFDEMMARFARRSHFVSIATPIHLHAAMHAAVASRNLGCYLEKPPTLDPRELEAMIAVERTSDFQTEVGFNYISETWRHALKRRILDGEWGELRAISFYGAWDRGRPYYRRCPWAGKLMLEDRLVLDSCFGNAISHNIHNLLFFAGKDGIFSWAEPRAVRCELYRAYPIESTDTVFSEMTTTDGIELRVAVSHACAPGRDLEEVIHCERAEIRIHPYESAEILHRSGKRERMEADPNARLFRENFIHYLDYLRGRKERPLTRLADSRPFVLWNALNYLAARRIQAVPGVAGGKDAVFIAGIEDVMRKFVRTGAFPSEQGVPWGHRGGMAFAGDEANLQMCILEMAGRISHAEARRRGEETEETSAPLRLCANSLF